MANSKFVISNEILFSMTEKLLAEGKRVKFTVSGNSMWPLIIHNRDSVMLVPCDKERLKKGEIILFKTNPYHYVLHRITKVVKGGYITTGDGNLHRDGFVCCKQVVAKVSEIYRKDRVIICSKWYWKLFFRIWMFLFPIRGLLQWLIIKI